MFKRTSRGAAMAASALLAMLVAVGSAKANITWGTGTASSSLVAVGTASQASLQAFNQSNPIVINQNGSIPAVSKTTQFAVCLVNNVDGSQRVVMMLRYLDGSVYTIVNSDATLATLAASATSTIGLTGKFYFVTAAGQTTLRQQVTLNGQTTSIIWGSSASIINGFKNTDGTCKQPYYGGVALTESADASM